MRLGIAQRQQQRGERRSPRSDRARHEARERQQREPADHRVRLEQQGKSADPVSGCQDEREAGHELRLEHIAAVAVERRTAEDHVLQVTEDAGLGRHRDRPVLRDPGPDQPVRAGIPSYDEVLGRMSRCPRGGDDDHDERQQQGPARTGRRGPAPHGGQPEHQRQQAGRERQGEPRLEGPDQQQQDAGRDPGRADEGRQDAEDPVRARAQARALRCGHLSIQPGPNGVDRRP